MMKKIMPLSVVDLPSCEFLKSAMSDEEGAIAKYTTESKRTKDSAVDETFSNIAKDEMRHWWVIRDLALKQGCKLQQE